MKTLYLEAYSGISGDMTVAALLDLGADEKVLRDGLASLGVGGYDIEISKVKKSGITACDFNVILHHEHHHENEHGHDEHVHNHGHCHDEHEHGCYDHYHYHENEHEHSHEHRGIEEITAMIEAAQITGRAKSLAKKIFNIIAEAEAKVHGLPVNEVHFHEVGAVDSIVDIVGAAICVDNLDIEKVICTPLREGQGTVWCQHGRVPVPAPATLEIASAHKIPLVITQNDGEMVTPTGIAIAAALCDSFDAISSVGDLRIVRTGYGAGKKDFACKKGFASPATANVLRASIIVAVDGSETVRSFPSGESDEVLELACNLDDMTAEQTAYACEVFMANGALDCWLTPITMKKGRQGVMLSLLINPVDEENFTRLLFLHTSTIGVRVTAHRRRKMTRRQSQIETKYGGLALKECSYGNICKTSVEYESAKKLANSHDIPISEVYNEAAKYLK